MATTCKRPIERKCNALVCRLWFLVLRVRVAAPRSDPAIPHRRLVPGPEQARHVCSNDDVSRSDRRVCMLVAIRRCKTNRSELAYCATGAWVASHLLLARTKPSQHDRASMADLRSSRKLWSHFG